MTCLAFIEIESEKCHEYSRCFRCFEFAREPYDVMSSFVGDIELKHIIKRLKKDRFHIIIYFVDLSYINVVTECFGKLEY